mgnify:CR=1 FL=1
MGSPISKKIIDNICVNVLIFPGIAAAKTAPPCSTSKRRSPVTASSRHTMIATTQAGAQPRAISITNAAIVNILSAKGSANLPKLETTFHLRAK